MGAVVIASDFDGVVMILSRVHFDVTVRNHILFVKYFLLNIINLRQKSVGFLLNSEYACRNRTDVYALILHTCLPVLEWNFAESVNYMYIVS